ncbi:MAG: PcfK-like family protein, partial [Muribaculaceae bacterium]|nr:PcfK-like family protein [Muribaculaceae bacterium]
MQDKNQSAKNAIKSYLDRRAASDPLFATSYAKPGKNLDECFRYILGEARKRGSAVCMTDDEVFGLAVHYYDEDDIKIAPAPCNSVATTSHKPQPQVRFSEEELAAAREAALKRFEEECLEDERKRAKPRKKPRPARGATRPPGRVGVG